MRERELTDDQWTALARHLPPQRGVTGRPAKDHRLVVEGILWRLRTGAPWHDLPERNGPSQSVYTRCQRWQRAGVWDRTLAALQATADARGGLDWSLHFLDGTSIRAHPHAAGAKKGAVTRALGAAAGLGHEAAPARRGMGQASSPGCCRAGSARSTTRCRGCWTAAR